MYTFITYVVKADEKGIKLKNYEEKDEAFENDAEYELDGFVVDDSEPVQKYAEEETPIIERAKRACYFVGDYMTSMLEVFGDEYDTDEENDEDYEANEDSSDEDSELDQSQEEDGDDETDEEADDEEEEEENGESMEIEMSN